MAVVVENDVDSRWVWARWRVLCLATGADGPLATSWEQDLVDRHNDPDRHYHNSAHLGAVLDALDRLGAIDPVTEFATFFHDAVYDPTAPENEARSAELAVEALLDLDVEVNITEVVRCIEATGTHSIEQPGSAEDRYQLAAFLDADMSILGQAAPIYARYANAIRREYQFLPDIVYRERRADVLSGFLDRQRIYLTEIGWVLWEAQARVNLEQELASLTRR